MRTDEWVQLQSLPFSGALNTGYSNIYQASKHCARAWAKADRNTKFEMLAFY